MAENRSDANAAPTDEFVQLFTAAQRPLYLFILSQTANVLAAEEVLQETNLVIWAKSQQFETGSNFGAWSRQIASYEVMKWRQRFKRDKLTFSNEFINTIAAEAATRSTKQESQQAALQNCLQKLTSEDRELIQQRYRPGISGKELAAELGRHANSVYQSLGRIRRMLLDCINRQLALD